MQRYTASFDFFDKLKLDKSGFKSLENHKSTLKTIDF
jgi:hypothetical protein